MELYSERNAYADHLVEVNKTNPVVTISDVCNNLGAIIVPAGTYITEDVANKLSRFTLLYPLELQVNLANKITPNQLFRDIQDAQIGDVEKYAQAEAGRIVAQQCGSYSAFPLLAQKITVLSERIPEKYGDTQSVTCFAVLLGLKLGLSDEAMNVVFMAAQMHDAGFLNIDPDYSFEVYRLSEEEQRSVYAAQLEEGKAFLDRVPRLSKRVGQAVSEHRERKDGSGWPSSLSGDGLCVESQIIGMAVMLNEAYQRKLKPRGYDASKLSPVLQMQSASFDPEIYNSAIELLKANRHKVDQAIPLEFMPSLTRYLVVLQRTLIHWLELAKATSINISQKRNASEELSSEKIIDAIEFLCCQSGLWESNMRDSLLEVVDQSLQESYPEVEVLALMYEAVLDKFKKLQWSMQLDAQSAGADVISRCEELNYILQRLPNDHFEAMQRYENSH